jgi:hypothetical protein
MPPFAKMGLLSGIPVPPFSLPPILEDEGRRVVSVVWYESDVAERKGSWLICEDENIAGEVFGGVAGCFDDGINIARSARRSRGCDFDSSAAVKSWDWNLALSRLTSGLGKCRTLQPDEGTAEAVSQLSESRSHLKVQRIDSALQGTMICRRDYILSEDHRLLSSTLSKVYTIVEMHGTERLCVPKFRIQLQRRSVKCPSKLPRCCVKATSSGLRPYTTAAPLRRSSQIKNVFIASAVFLGTFIGYIEITDTRAGIHRWLAVPLIRTIWPNAEDAHKAGVRVLKELSRLGLNPRDRGQDAKELETEVFGIKLVNPLGISSGLDKHGEIPIQLLALGLLHLGIAITIFTLCKELRDLFSRYVFPLLFLQNKYCWLRKMFW